MSLYSTRFGLIRIELTQPVLTLLSCFYLLQISTTRFVSHVLRLYSFQLATVSNLLIPTHPYWTQLTSSQPDSVRSESSWPASIRRDPPCPVSARPASLRATSDELMDMSQPALIWLDSAWLASSLLNLFRLYTCFYRLQLGRIRCVSHLFRLYSFRLASASTLFVSTRPYSIRLDSTRLETIRLVLTYFNSLSPALFRLGSTWFASTYSGEWMDGWMDMSRYALN